MSDSEKIHVPLSSLSSKHKLQWHNCYSLCIGRYFLLSDIGIAIIAT